MDSRRRGEDLLPRLAPVPRSVPLDRSRAGVGDVCARVPGLCRHAAALWGGTVAVVGRGLTVLPVLEILGLAGLLYLLGR